MQTLSAHSIVLLLAFYFSVIQGHSALRAGKTGLGTNGQSCNSLHRQYKEGETLSYEMDASNRNGQETRNYSARADGIVKKQSDGTYYEEYAWSNLQNHIAGCYWLQGLLALLLLYEVNRLSGNQWGDLPGCNQQQTIKQTRALIEFSAQNSFIR